MQWIWLIPLVVVAVVVLSSLVRNAPRPEQRVVVPPQPPGEPLRQQRTSAEMDRFLKEARRRRQLAEEAEQRRRAEQQSQAESIPMAIPVLEAIPMRKVMAEAAIPVVKAAPRIAEPKVEKPKEAAGDVTKGVAAAVVSKKEMSPAARKVMEYLQSPHSLRAAFMLTEVLGPPKSKRRG